MCKILKQTKVYECNDYDRYIWVEYTDNEVTELNYHQGISEDFDPYYATNDEDLLRFYKAIKDALYHMTDVESEAFNLAIDMHFDYKNNY
jgi:hypothetical protein